MDSGYLLRVEHEEFAKRVSEENDRFNARLKDVEAAQRENNKLLVSIERIAVATEANERELKKINVRLDKQDEKFEALEGRDGENWREFTKYVGFAVAGILIGYIFSQIGF